MEKRKKKINKRDFAGADAERRVCVRVYVCVCLAEGDGEKERTRNMCIHKSGVKS